MKLEREAWNTEAATILAPALGEDAEIIAGEVKRGQADLYRVNGGALFAVLRREDSELVIVAIAGRGLRAFGRWIWVNAPKAGFATVRFHTQRPALIRLLREFNPRPLEYVARIDLNG